MGLDIYAGTLTRYYAHNWKSAVQQWAEENGYAFQKITPDGAEVWIYVNTLDNNLGFLFFTCYLDNQNIN